jgi:hypothetical protein
MDEQHHPSGITLRFQPPKRLSRKTEKQSNAKSGSIILFRIDV